MTTRHPKGCRGSGDRSLQKHFERLDLDNLALANPDVRAYFKQAGVPHPEPWTVKPEIPSSEEILGADTEECVDLMPNKVEGPWRSKEEYLRAHYDLLREDSVAPLRDAVAYVRNDPQMMDSKDVSVYDKVHIVGLTFAQQGLGFRIQFSTQRAGRKIVWEYTKRLISGSMVALSPANDAFQKKCVVAIVAARPLDKVQQHPSEIDIYFAHPEETQFDPHQEWIMVEAKNGYFEAVCHNMTALQKISRESFPLARSICFLEPNSEPPQYVKEDPTRELLSAIDENQPNGKLNFLEDWPGVPIGDLDNTQWEALRQMLTKSLAIVQGPPGTGKTFVSIVALKVLLANMKDDEPPIVVSSHTNHALDQLLSHISNFEPNYIRLGSRSSDAEIKKRTLYQVRRGEPTISLHGSVLASARGKLRGLQSAIKSLLQPFDVSNSMMPISSSLFVKYGLLKQAQYESLVKGSKAWIRPGQEEDCDPILAWLGDQMMAFEVRYADDNFGFVEDEIDLEYEQLKELEAEHGVDEDDYESLKGEYMRIKEGSQAQGKASSKTIAKYSHCSDMWNIPTKERGPIYNSLREQLKEKVLNQLRQLASQYAKVCQDIRIGKWERDNHTLTTTKVIGVTATGMSKYRGLISSLNPKVVLIEEAAEAIEAPIAASCFQSVQQMILVGDHQQLKGSCAVAELGGDPFFLDVSMFERLVRNGLQYITLKRQRRMAPEIRRLLKPIYNDLQDHPSVHERPYVPGMGLVRSYFFSHTWPETSDSLSSKVNDTEAEMVVGFFTYLVLSGVPIKNITVLTFYNGQRKKLLKLMRSHSYLQGQYLKVVTVDSYQGEENEVVILSLVRSGDRGIGFLSLENRVCVALSRAKSGFFIFGNANLLASADPIWRQVIDIIGSAKSPPRLSSQLPVTCIRHNNVVLKEEPSDWAKTHAGCTLPCREPLECGHTCPLLCHNFSHDQVRCDKSCQQPMQCGHMCSKPCGEPHVCFCGCGGGRKALANTERSLLD